MQILPGVFLVYLWIETNVLSIRGIKMKCVKCGKEEINPYIVKSGKRKGKIQSYCRKCNGKNVVERQREFKRKCIQYKGGKCSICGYHKCQAALDFHHLDPLEKDFNVSKYRQTSWNKRKDSILSELDKCILVCKNCHSEIHFNVEE